MSEPLEIRGNTEQIDAKWMSHVMEHAGVAQGEIINTAHFEGFIGTGQTGQNARYRLHWSHQGSRPGSVIVKFASGNKSVRDYGYASGAYKTEVAFYNQLARQMQVRVPDCYAALYDETKPDSVIVMEDLCFSRQGDQLSGLTADQCALAISGAVGFHAPRWGDPTLVDFAPHKSPELFAALLLPAYQAAIRTFMERLGDQIDADIIALIHDMGGWLGDWFTSSQLPATLIHMDFRADNLMFGVNKQAPPLVVIDWQTASVGAASWDVAYLLGAAFQPEVRARLERDLLKQYIEEMKVAGIELKFEQVWHEYRLGALWGLLMAVGATAVAEETERGNNMLIQMAQSHGRHALDLETVSLLC